MVGPGCERVGAVKRAKIWEMIIDAPEDLHSEDEMKDIALLQTSSPVFSRWCSSASLICLDSKCSRAIVVFQ